MSIFDAFTHTLPVVLLILLGTGLRAVRLVSSESVADIKKLVVSLTLPLLVFRAFATMQFETRYLVLVGVVFALNVGVLLLARAGRGVSPFFPALMTGFEAGMVGYAVFTAIYGNENISRFAVVDLGQVLFVFFVLVTTLETDPTGRSPSGLVLAFLRTPVIAGILAGIFFNVTGLFHALQSWAVTGAVLDTLALVAGLTTPLVALVLGYDLRFQRGMPLAKPLLTVAARMVVWVGFGLVVNVVLVDRLLHLDPIFQAAVMTMFVLPPPFVIPLYVRQASQEERAYIINTLSLATVIGLAAVVLVRLFYAG